MYRSNRCVEEGPTMTATFPKEACEPIYECPCERVCHREINHVVPHMQPVNTRIINHHIYHHTYTPCYTCCEENEITHVYDCNPCRNKASKEVFILPYICYNKHRKE